MKAKIKSTQQIVEVTCVDDTPDRMEYFTYENVVNHDRYLGNELNFDDLMDYKTWTENLVHDLAVKAYEPGWEKRKDVAADIVLYAFEVMDRLMQENKTWR